MQEQEEIERQEDNSLSADGAISPASITNDLVSLTVNGSVSFEARDSYYHSSFSIQSQGSTLKSTTLFSGKQIQFYVRSDQPVRFRSSSTTTVTYPYSIPTSRGNTVNIGGQVTFYYTGTNAANSGNVSSLSWRLNPSSLYIVVNGSTVVSKISGTDGVFTIPSTTFSFSSNITSLDFVFGFDPPTQTKYPGLRPSSFTWSTPISVSATAYWRDSMTLTVSTVKPPEDHIYYPLISEITSILSTIYITITNLAGTVISGFADVISAVQSSVPDLSGLQETVSSILSGVQTVGSNIITKANEIVSAVSNGIQSIVSAPSSDKSAADQFRDDMQQVTDKIDQAAQEIEQVTNRPDPSQTAQKVNPFDGINVKDSSFTGIQHLFTLILQMDFVVTLFLMLFGFAFVSYVLFGKKG